MFISTTICSEILQTACHLIKVTKKCKGISKHLIFTVFSKRFRIVGFGSIVLTIITYEKDAHKSMCPVKITVRVNSNSNIIKIAYHIVQRGLFDIHLGNHQMEVHQFL